jgi:hypothetical protein
MSKRWAPTSFYVATQKKRRSTARRWTASVLLISHVPSDGKTSDVFYVTLVSKMGGNCSD